MATLIDLYTKWGDIWEAFPLLTLIVIFLAFVLIYKIQNVRTRRG